MISPLVGRYATEIHANTMRAFKTSAYSDDGYRRKQAAATPVLQKA
jgi:hypothetical protein